jgi:hypothetical protein
VVRSFSVSMRAGIAVPMAAVIVAPMVGLAAVVSKEQRLGRVRVLRQRIRGGELHRWGQGPCSWDESTISVGRPGAEGPTGRYVPVFVARTGTAASESCTVLRGSTEHAAPHCRF